MERKVVGKIQGYDVIYIPEKDIVFCKNTVVNYINTDRAINSSMSRDNVDNKLTITKDNGMIYLGCLNTTRSNVSKILNQIKVIKNEQSNQK